MAVDPFTGSTLEGYEFTDLSPSGNVVLQPYGVHYNVYTSPGGLIYRYSGSSDVRAMMIGIRAGDTNECVRVEHITRTL